jgi:ABC-type phosphate transport system substrate-binding protein
MTAMNKTCALLLGLAAIFASAAAGAQDVVIVVNSNVSISGISEAQLRDIFTGARSRLDDGTRVVPVLLRGGPVHEVFLDKHLRENPEEFRTRWRKAVFTGQGSMPKEFSSETAVLEYVAATPGAMGYVSRTSGNTAVKVLPVSP